MKVVAKNYADLNHLEEIINRTIKVKEDIHTNLIQMMMKKSRPSSPAS